MSDDAPSSVRPPPAIALDTGWRSVPDPDNVGLREGWARGLPANAGSVAIPNDFNPNVSPAGDRGTVVWYALRFDGPRAVAGRSWNVRFDQVRRTAEVWLNGRRIGASAEPYAPFSVPPRRCGLAPRTSWWCGSPMRPVAARFPRTGGTGAGSSEA
ncbi:MAG: sugar-binding domain-containing protein [Solirubrobacteraceae bacterium]